MNGLIGKNMRDAFPASRRGATGFVLLEVIVAMVILGISIATIMRSFTVSLAAIRKNDATTQATVLAETALQSMEAEPPGKGKSNGDFEADGFPRYSYDVVSKKEELKYRLKTESRPENLRELQSVNLTINFKDPRGRTTHPSDAFLILAPLERFSYESKLQNELFTEEEGI